MMMMMMLGKHERTNEERKFWPEFKFPVAVEFKKQHTDAHN